MKISIFFIKAEQTAGWHLHLFALKKRSPIFAASGHNNYEKSFRLYLQSQCIWLYKQFAENGCQNIRKSNKYFSALPLALVIKQFLMRAIKVQAGLTQGRAMTESVILQ